MAIQNYYIKYYRNLMKKILVLAIFALFACNHVHAVEEEEDDDVLVFTDKNFND